ncbi:hypothetical protein DL98DRAFT_602280, partial [Cadophora sp. DSE1049]
FVNPGNIYRPAVRYWLPDASVSADVVKSDLEDLASIGLGGFEFLPFYLYGLPAGGPTPTDWNKYGYGSTAYKQVFDAALQAAQDQQLLMSFALGANQGQGSPAKMESTGLAKELAYSSIVVPSGSTFSGHLALPVNHPPSETSIASFMHPTVDRIDQKLIAVIAARIERDYPLPVNNTYLEEDSLIDITLKVVDGQLSFSPPKEGDWQIMAFYERYTNQKSCSGAENPSSIIGNGSWIVDHFSSTGAKVTTDFIDQNVLDPSNQKALANVGLYAWEDSLEMIAAAWWTPDFLSEFKARRGYDFTKYLPFIYNGENYWGQLVPTYINRTILGAGTDGGQRVNDDYRTTLNDLYQRYLEHMQDWSHSRGLKFSNQPAYGLPLDMAADIPLIDTPETESLGFPTLDQVRQFTGSAHMANKNIISSEMGARTKDTSAYSQTMPDLLTTINLQLVAGVNEFVLHGSPYSGDYAETTWPGYTPFFYTVTDMHSRCQPAWESYKSSMDYVARNSMISQLGTAKIDLAFLTTPDAFTILALNTSSVSSAGYSYEYIGPTDLNLGSSTIQGKVLSPDGPAFRTIVIDGSSSIPYNTAFQLESYAKLGFPIVFLGSIPTNISGICLPPNCNTNVFQTGLNKLVADYPETVKISPSLDTLPQTLSTLEVTPRVLFEGGGWYQTLWKGDVEPGVDYVYFWNPNLVVETITNVEFSERRYPFKVDAWTGTYSPIVEYYRNGTTLSMALNIKSNDSALIAFSNSRVFHGQLSPTNVPTPLSLKTWNITIEDWHPTSNLSSTQTKVSNHTILDTALKPWTQYNLSNVSGIGHYTTSFRLSSPEAKLSLGTIQHTVKVFLNGDELPPINLFDAVIDISSYARIGVNQLLIDATTTLFNAVKARSSTIMTAGVPASLANPLLSENATSLEYGLLGPVVVTPYQAVKIA